MEFRMRRKLLISLNILTGLSLALGAVFAKVTPAQAAVAFNTFQISYTQGETNKDFPLLDARNVTAGSSPSTSQADHDNGVQASPGDVIEFVIYYHNSGVAEDEATNVIIKANLPGGSRFDHEVSATIDSDQTNPISSNDAFRGGNIIIHVSGSQPQTLEFISGSVRHFPNRSASGQVLSDGNNLVSAGVNIGTIKGCFEFSGFIIFRARVGTEQPSENRDLSITKKVLNLTKNETFFRDSTSANPGDRLKFEIRFDTTGNASQTNVIVRDILPANISYVSGTERVDGVLVGNEFDLFGSGRNFGSLSAGSNRVITFEANVAGPSSFSGTTTLTNTANVRSDQVSTRQDVAEVSVQMASTIQFQLRKTAFNLTQGTDAQSVAANPGDVIVYTLYYKNTGSTTISGAVIEDDIHDILELAGITDMGGAISVNDVIRYQGIDVLPGVEISRSFQVKVREANLFPQSSDLVMVNIYGNEVRVVVRKPQVTGIITPPRTGASEWLSGSFAIIATLGYWLIRKKALRTKITS